MSFDFDTINSTAMTNINTMSKQIQQFSQTMDPNSQSDAIQLQEMYAEMEAQVTAASGEISAIRDMLKGIYQKL